VAALLALLPAGCGQPAAPPGTGAEAVAREYFEELLRQDWGRAYAALDPEERARRGVESFARLAQSYHHRLGFEPREVFVRSCEEHGDEAIAHVVFTGQGGGKQRYHKDAITLRRGAAGWGVVLPPRFGQGP
jgi:hypothetical protein